MDFGTLIRIILRRWIVVIPILLLAFGLAWRTGSSALPDYEANSTMILLQAPDAETNPLAEIGRPVNTAALAIALAVNDPESHRRLAELGHKGAYQLGAVEDQPLINIVTTGRSPGQALGLLDAVKEAVRLELDQFQISLDAPQSQFMTTRALSNSPTARPLYGSRDRAVAAIIVLGMGAAITAAIMLESFLTRRRPRPDLVAQGPAPNADAAINQALRAGQQHIPVTPGAFDEGHIPTMPGAAAQPVATATIEQVVNGDLLVPTDLEAEPMPMGPAVRSRGVPTTEQSWTIADMVDRSIGRSVSNRGAAEDDSDGSADEDNTGAPANGTSADGYEDEVVVEDPQDDAITDIELVANDQPGSDDGEGRRRRFGRRRRRP